MMHYTDFNPLGKYPDAIKAPVAYAFDIAGQAWAGYIITIAATVGLISVLMVMIMDNPGFSGNVKRRINSKTFSKVNPTTSVPSKNLIILGGVISIIASFTPINDLEHMTSFGLCSRSQCVCCGLGLRVKNRIFKETSKCLHYQLLRFLGIAITSIWSSTWAKKHKCILWVGGHRFFIYFVVQ